MISVERSEISHSSHLEHNLKWLPYNTSYKCDGCKEPGSGPRFGCETCGFNLHDDCLSPSPYKSHDFYKDCVLKFFDRPQGKGNIQRYCDACVRDIEGFVYHCELGRTSHTCCKTGRDLHPRCSNLPKVAEVGGVILHLKEKISTKCCLCGLRKRGEDVTGWSYVSTCKTHHFHVACVSMLVQSWNESALFHGNKDQLDLLALKTRAPSHLAVQTRYGGRGSKLGRILKLILKFIISVLCGDPTAIVLGLVESLSST